MNKLWDWIQQLDLVSQVKNKPNSIPRSIDKDVAEGLREGFSNSNIDALRYGYKKTTADTRYRNPKEAPKASDEMVEETIENTEIYRRAKELILNAQKEQVAYGIDKYPEPLNADSWSIKETLEHKLSESVDRLHYDVMLVIQLEKLLKARKENDPEIEEPKTATIYTDDGSIETYMNYERGPARYHSIIQQNGTEITANIILGHNNSAWEMENYIENHLMYVNHVITGQVYSDKPLFAWEFRHDPENNEVKVLVFVTEEQYVDEFRNAVELGLRDTATKQW